MNQYNTRAGGIYYWDTKCISKYEVPYLVYAPLPLQFDGVKTDRAYVLAYDRIRVYI